MDGARKLFVFLPRQHLFLSLYLQGMGSDQNKSRGRGESAMSRGEGGMGEEEKRT